MLLEQREPLLVDVARGAVCGHQQAPRLGRAAHVLRLRREHLGGAIGKRARRVAIVGSVLRALLEHEGEVDPLLALLVERLERLEGPGPGRGVDEASPGADRALGVAQLVRADLGDALVRELLLAFERRELADALEHLDEVLHVAFALVDAREGARGREDGAVIRALRGEDAGERRAGTLGVAAAEEQVTHLRGDARADAGVLGDGRDARKRARDLERASELDAERHVALAKLVVGGIDPERLLERLEGALRVVELVLLEDADPAEDVASSRPTRVLELDAEVARAFVRRRRACSERRGGPCGEALALEETRRDASRLCVRRIDLEERLDVRHRALGLLELVGEDLDQLLPDPCRFVCGRRRIGGEGLLEHARDVAIAVRAHEARLERVAERLVTGLETDELLVRLDRLVLEHRALEEVGGALEDRDLFRLRPVGRRLDTELGELLVVVGARELRVDALERACVTREGAERAFEIGRGTELVAEHVAEERRCPEEELSLYGRQERLQLPALRRGLVCEGELGDAVELHRGVVELVPDRSVERVLRQRRDDGVQDLFFVLELCLERRNTCAGLS